MKKNSKKYLFLEKTKNTGKPEKSKKLKTTKKSKIQKNQ